MNYSTNLIKSIDAQTGKVSFYYQEKISKHRPKGLTVYRINDKIMDYIYEKFNYSSGAIKLLRYIKNNLDSNNRVVLKDIKKLTSSLGISQNAYYRTTKELQRMRFMYKTEENTYQVNPFIVMATKGRSEEQTLLLQAIWEEKFGEWNNSKFMKLDNPNETIIGGEEYYRYLKSDEWDKLKIQKKAQAKERCELCGSDKNIEIHHRSYENLYNENLDDLQCLCHLCHIKMHMKGA